MGGRWVGAGAQMAYGYCNHIVPPLRCMCCFLPDVVQDLFLAPRRCCLAACNWLSKGWCLRTSLKVAVLAA